MFRLFKKNNRFEFDVNIDSKPFESDLSLSQIGIIKKFHRKQKRTIEKYASEVAKKCKHDFRDNAKKIKTSCLELSVLYHHFFTNVKQLPLPFWTSQRLLLPVSYFRF